MAKFDADTLRQLRDVREVTIRTEKHPDGAVAIWVVVADDETLVRSVRAGKGRLVQGPRDGRLRHIGLRRPPASGSGAPGERRRFDRKASREYLRKYQPSPYAQSMVRAEVLPTTLRLEPR